MPNNKVVYEEGQAQFSNSRIKKEIEKMIKEGVKYKEIENYLIKYFEKNTFIVYNHNWHSTWSGPEPKKKGRK